MLKVAIVGNIASGKTTVEKILQEKGFKVFDTDKIAHRILKTNPNIINFFGTTDRKEIAHIVFSAPEKLKQLESIIHPEVKKELLKIFSDEEATVFISVPQLFEAGFESLFDKIIYITADKDLRKKRLIKRNSLSPEEADIRINAQTENNKKEKCDFVVENNGSVEDLKFELEKVISILIG